MTLPTYQQYLAEDDPARRLAMVVAVSTRPIEERDGWPNETTYLFTSQRLHVMARAVLEAQ